MAGGAAAGAEGRVRNRPIDHARERVPSEGQWSQDWPSSGSGRHPSDDQSPTPASPASSAGASPEQTAALAPAAQPPAERLKWNGDLHRQFLRCLTSQGGAFHAKPKIILQDMQAMGHTKLTLNHIKSHLQKYRLALNAGTVHPNSWGRSQGQFRGPEPSPPPSLRPRKASSAFTQVAPVQPAAPPLHVPAAPPAAIWQGWVQPQVAPPRLPRAAPLHISPPLSGVPDHLLANPLLLLAAVQDLLCRPQALAPLQQAAPHARAAAVQLLRKDSSSSDTQVSLQSEGTTAHDAGARQAT